MNIWVSSLSFCVAAVSSLGQFGARYACLVFWGFLAGTGLTGVLHRPDRCRAALWKSPGFTVGTDLTGGAHQPDWCRSVRLEFCVLLRFRVCEVGSWFLGLVALQWLRGLGQLG
jgi:hypothetical protein